jgi:glutaminase
MNHNNMQKTEELPGHAHLRKTLDRLHKTYSACHEGNVATYIPELAKANPDHFGVAVVGIDGEVYEAGETSVEFTIQSISKAFVFGLAVETHGRDAVLKRVGVEPSGDAFNSLELRSSRKPFNPMINAGAITDTGMITGASVKERMNKILRLLSDAAGRELRVDEGVYRSEQETGHRNRAIGHLLKNVDLIDGEVDEVLDLYFQQCSVLLNARDLATMGATLANLGTNPVTGKEVLSFDSVRDVLSVMFTCGMYDFAGEWAFRVGIPAKSGVGGGILAVINRQLGIGTYSPRLDSMGNSVRGIRLCTDLAEEMGLHIFNFTNPGSSFIKATFAKK